jgi:hypothetical protein
MASTPPLQIISPQTPSTPLYGAAYDRPTRQSSRIKQRATSHAQVVHQTPARQRSVTSPAHDSSSIAKSQVTPKKAPRRVQVVSPTSPNTLPTPDQPPKQPAPSSTTFANGMLPTPVKTPKKKPVTDIKTASAALFQDPFTIEEMATSTPRKNRKTKRYNGYSLESFRAEDEVPTVQVFTDNRDKVPEGKTSATTASEIRANDDSSGR